MGPLDVVTIGRSSVDLYGQQVGGRLEDMASFSKAVGGCPTNIAIGTARLGLRSAVITRVGDEHMGRFIREQLLREGVEVGGVHTDPARLTALVLLGVRDEHSFPLIFYRADCADAALDEGDIDPALVARAAAVLVTGTHFARPAAAAAQLRAITLARAKGGCVVFDIDYRPNLWGLAGHGAGESRYLRSAGVTALLAPVLPLCDLIVGTEEEFHIAGGAEDTLAALRAARAASRATLVCKRGPMGCLVFPGEIPDRLEDGIRGPGFPVEVYNVLGAGDAFMSGFLRGWLRDETLETCCAWANACGAFAVSRLLCSPESPTWTELQHFLRHGSAHLALRHDAALNHVHWATTRRPQPGTVMALAIDHRAQLASLDGATPERIAAFKGLALDAALRVAGGRPGFGMLLDGTYGRAALLRAAGTEATGTEATGTEATGTEATGTEATGTALWVARPVERPGSRPLDFDGMDSLAAHLAEWPVTQTVKCLCFYHPDDPPELRERQERELRRLFEATRSGGRELLLEIIAGKHGALHDDTVARVVARLYAIGIRPDWWKLEPQPGAAAWRAVGDAVRAGDAFCRGILVLGLEAPIGAFSRVFREAAGEPLVRGFAIGRTIFGAAAASWLAGRIDDATATDAMARRFAELVEAWQAARRDAAA